MINAHLMIRMGRGTDGSSHTIAPSALNHPVGSIFFTSWTALPLGFAHGHLIIDVATLKNQTAAPVVCSSSGVLLFTTLLIFFSVISSRLNRSHPAVAVVGWSENMVTDQWRFQHFGDLQTFVACGLRGRVFRVMDPPRFCWWWCRMQWQ